MEASSSSFKISFPTSEKNASQLQEPVTYCHLEIIALPYENHKKHINNYVGITQSFLMLKEVIYCNGFDQRVARQQLCKHAPTRNNRGSCISHRSDRHANRLAG
jgi:hypothetical protein